MGTILAELEKRKLTVSKLRFFDIAALKKMVVRASIAAALNYQSVGCNPPYGQGMIGCEGALEKNPETLRFGHIFSFR